MVRVGVTDVAWIEASPCLQNEQHEATKKALQEAVQQAAQLQGDLDSLQARFASACAAKSELVEEKGRLETRVRRQTSRRRLGRRDLDRPAARCYPMRAGSPSFALPQLSMESNVRQQLKDELAARDAAATALEGELAMMREHSESDLLAARADAIASEQRYRELQSARQELEQRLAASEAAVEELTATVTKMQADVQRLEAANVDLKVAMDAKVRSVWANRAGRRCALLAP